MLIQPGLGLIPDGTIAHPEDLLVARHQMARGQGDEAHAAAVHIAGYVEALQLRVVPGLPGVCHGAHLPVFPVGQQLLQRLIVLGADGIAQLLGIGVMVEPVLPDGPLALFDGLHEPVGDAPLRILGAGEEMRAFVAHDDLPVLHPHGHLLAESLEGQGPLEDGGQVFVLPVGLRDDPEALGVIADHPVADQFPQLPDALGCRTECIHGASSYSDGFQRV